MWFTPLIFITVALRLIRSELSENEVSQMDITRLNQLINRVSSVFLGFFVSFVIVYVPIISSEEGMNVTERVLSRQFLENYKSVQSDFVLTGNIWSLT